MTKELVVRDAVERFTALGNAVDVKLNPRSISGEQVIITFANGYGASVVRSVFSYGGGEGLWEVAVLGKDGRLTYDTPVTDDVIGHLSVDEVVDILVQIGEVTDEEVEANTRSRKIREIADDLRRVLDDAEEAELGITEYRRLLFDGTSVVSYHVVDGVRTVAVLELDTATGQWEVGQ